MMSETISPSGPGNTGQLGNAWELSGESSAGTDRGARAVDKSSAPTNRSAEMMRAFIKDGLKQTFTEIIKVIRRRLILRGE